eukprot:5187472-Amphidinium_carterae.3
MGPTFLTKAFHVAGTLPKDNATALGAGLHCLRENEKRIQTFVHEHAWGNTLLSALTPCAQCSTDCIVAAVVELTPRRESAPCNGLAGISRVYVWVCTLNCCTKAVAKIMNIKEFIGGGACFKMMFDASISVDR